MTSLFKPLSDPALNNKLLALAVGQMLCSLATLIHDSYLPVYIQDELGLSNTKIGALQGAAQFLCQMSKGVSGVVGDLLGSQVRMLVFGTFITLLCKPMFAALSSVYGIFGLTACIYWFFTAKLLDRLSKGIREAPSKAIMNELARDSGDAPDAAYGLRQSLGTAGMLGGATMASLTFALTGKSYEKTFLVAALFPIIALVWMCKNFKDELITGSSISAIAAQNRNLSLGPEGGTSSPPGASKPEGESGPGASKAADGAGKGSSSSGSPPASDEPKLGLLAKAKVLFTSFRPVYWQALAVVAILYFARFDPSFLSLRAKQVMDKAAIPLLTFVNTVIQVALTAPLARIAGSSVSARNRLLLVGFVVMIACNACFLLPYTANMKGMFLGSGLLGLHMALTHSITISMVASYMPTGVVPGIGRISGTAVSFTDLLLGFVLAASNGVAGMLSDWTASAGYGNVGCFLGGATACTVAGILLIILTKFGDLGKQELIVGKVAKGKA